VADVLKSRGHNVKFYFEINDFDPMDGIPSYLDTPTYEKYMGVPLCNIPSPVEGFANFAEYYGQEYVTVLEKVGFGATVYRASELYRSGQMNGMIKKALERRLQVREINYRISKSEKPDDWYPLNVVCENCGNLSATKITSFDGELVTYTCSSDTIAWAKGCNYSGTMSPYNGNAKLPWKLDWAAKFVAKEVSFEGGGKDHYTKGGSRQVAEAVCREIFDHEPPYGVFNEFFLFGGKKMSSSKGGSATAADMASILPPHILRLLLLRTPINRQIDFDPEGDAIPVLYDLYDKLAEKYWSGTRDDDSQLYTFSHLPDERSDIGEPRFLPRFSQVAFLVQMPHMDIYAEVAKMKEGELSDIDVAELDDRIKYAKHWLKEYADDKFIFTLQATLPEVATSLTESQLSALALLSDKIASLDSIDGQVLHELIHEVKAESGLTPQEFFGAIYTVFLGKDSGPKVGWFLSTLDKEFLVKRLRGEG
jgi:lysyl-tRNA synthetase class 1